MSDKSTKKGIIKVIIFGTLLVFYVSGVFSQSKGEKVASEQEAERKRNISVKIGISYFNPSEKRCKDVYGSGVMYKGEFSIGIWRDLSLWIGGGFFPKKGELFYTKEETKLQIIPIGMGVKYVFFKREVNLYSGIGLKYYQLTETNPIGDVNKGGVGFCGEIGAFVVLGEGLMIDLSVDYSYCKMTPATRSINVGGFEVEIGVGYRF